MSYKVKEPVTLCCVSLENNNYHIKRQRDSEVMLFDVKQQQKLKLKTLTPPMGDTHSEASTSYITDLIVLHVFDIIKSHIH